VAPLASNSSRFQKLPSITAEKRLASLKETKAVVTQYHKYLTENSLIRSVSDPEILPP
jgi:hypothetical protein